MLIKFMSQKDAERIEPTKDMAIISICSPHSAKTRNLSKNWIYRIDLDFSDISDENIADNETFGLRKFTSGMAEEIYNFISSLPPNVNYIVIHCFQGVSRSSAVAKFLCEYYNQKFDNMYDHFYNKLVYNFLIKVQHL